MPSIRHGLVEVAERVTSRLTPQLSVRASVLLFLLVLSVGAAHAGVKIVDEYDKLIRGQDQVVTFGEDGFGDQISVVNGSLTISQTDIDLPGNSALPVQLVRRFTAESKYEKPYFGPWSLDIPHIYGTFANHQYNPIGWTVPGTSADRYKRCSKFSAPPELQFQVGWFFPNEYWNGSYLRTPESGDEELLGKGGAALVPSDGNSYYAVTKSGSALRCTSLATTSEAGSQGEGFVVVTPNGIIYTINHMVSSAEETISKPIDQFGGPMSAEVANGRASSAQARRYQPMGATTFTLPRKRVVLYVTKAEDRFGNYVNYVWNSTNPWQLLEINSNDGRKIVFSYGSNTVSATAAGKTWSYGADTSGAYVITRPDGSKWISNLSGLRVYKHPPSSGSGGCFVDVSYPGTVPTLTGSITAPTGATALYTMKPTKMGRSWVPWNCVHYYSDGGGGPLYLVEPATYFKLAVVSKKITGAGLPSSGLTWNYAYGPANACMSGVSNVCTTSSPTTRTVTLTDPDSVVTRYTVGNRFDVNDGDVLKVEHGVSGSSAKKVVSTTYAAFNASPYYAHYSLSPFTRGNRVMNSYKRPVRQVLTEQDSATYLWKVASDCSGIPYCFDAHARPTKVTKSYEP